MNRTIKVGLAALALAVAAPAFANEAEVDEDIAIGMEIPLPGDGGLADAMAKLPARYREVLLLRYDNGYSTREIAQMFQMKPDAAQKLLWRAKEALHKKLEESENV